MFSEVPAHYCTKTESSHCQSYIVLLKGVRLIGIKTQCSSLFSSRLIRSNNLVRGVHLPSVNVASKSKQEVYYDPFLFTIYASMLNNLFVVFNTARHMLVVINLSV